MKRLFSLLFIIVFSQGYSQITFKGVKTSTIVETNEDKKDIKEIDKIEFTKSDEENTEPIKDEISLLQTKILLLTILKQLKNMKKT